MSNIFGGPFEIEATNLDNTTFLTNVNSVGEAFTIIDQQITITNDSGLLLDPATHTLSDQLNFLVTNTNAAILGQYATIADLTDATTTINGRLDTIESLDTTQNGRLDAHDTELQNHEDRITAIENGETGEETRISALETFVAAQPGIDSAQDTSITDLGLRLDTAEQGISEHTNLINDNATAIANHLMDATAHDATQIYFLSPGGGSATRGFFLSGEGTTDSIYTPFTDTFTNTNAFKPDTTYHPIAFMNKIFVFSGDAGGSFVSVDGGLNFTALTTPWNINNLVTSAAVGEYFTSGTFALLLGMSSGEFYYTLDGTTFILDPVTAFSNQIISLTWSNYAEWHFVVHNDMTGVYAFDWSGVSNFFQYTATLPFEPTSIGYDANYGPIISSPSGTQYFNSGSWVVSSLLGSTQVYFTHSGNNVSGDYILIATTINGNVYSYILDSITGTVTDSWALIDTIVEAGTVSSLTQYEPNKYLVTFNPAANGGHQVVWFEWPFTFFHYQSSTLPAIRNLTGGCSAVYASTLPSTINIDINSGTIATSNVDEAIRNLSIANTQVRSAGYQTTGNVSSSISSALTPYRTAANQDTIDTSKLDVTTAASTYQTQANMTNYYPTSNPSGYITSSALTPYLTTSTAASTYYPTSNPSGYITSSALTPYLTTSTAASTYYPTSNPSLYQTASQVSSAITSGTSGVYYPVSNPDNFVTLSAANAAYYASSNPSLYQTAGNVASIIATNVNGYETLSHANSTFATLTQFSYLGKPNMRIVSSIGVASPAAGQAYDSIANALTGISAGTSIYVLPGTYNITSSITPPASISIIGVDKTNTIINYTMTSSGTMLVCNASNISLQNMTLKCNSTTANVSMTCIDLQSNNDTFFMDNMRIIMDNGTDTTGTSAIYGIKSTGNAVHVSDSVINIFETLIEVLSAGSGVKRCLSHAPTSGSGSDLHVDSSQFWCNRVGGSGTDYICVETSGANTPNVQLTNCFVSGFSNDVSQTTGVLLLGKSTVLYSATSNSLPFSFLGSAANWSFGDPGTLPGGTSYLYRGTATANPTLFGYRISKPTVVSNMFINSRVAAGGGNTVAFTILKNGVAGSVTATLTSALTSISDTTHAMQFTTGDILAVRCVSSGGAAADVIVQIDMY